MSKNTLTVTSEYSKTLLDLNRKKCLECAGLGRVNDAEPGDMYFNTWICPKCKGTGFNNVVDKDTAS